MSDETNTLLIRHLPEELSNEDKVDLLKHFGATHVRTMGNHSRMRNTAFAVFTDNDAASRALGRLHQLDVLDCRLIVEFSSKRHLRYHPSVLEKEIKVDSRDDKKKSETEKVLSEKEKNDKFKQKLSENLSNVSAKWEINYPFNPQLEYIYPSPNLQILTNIAHALTAVPRFYVQVLHLMNKMNLPAPFGPVTPAPPIPEGVPDQNNIPYAPDNVEELEMDVSSSSESELESDEDSSALLNKLPLKRPQKDPLKPKRKHKLQKIISAPKKQATSEITEVFERTDTGTGQKKIEFNLFQESRVDPQVSQDMNISDVFSGKAPKDLISLMEDDDSKETQGGFGKIEPVAKTDVEDESEEEEWGKSEFISSRRLRKGRLSDREMQEISSYRNYQAGEPTSRLYIKNVAKPVTEKDLHYIYGRYVDWDKEEEKIMFDIRLMKEGRMKGQAFVTLPNENVAKEAVHDTNKFLLKDKPLVVQFARSAKPKDVASEGQNNKGKK